MTNRRKGSKGKASLSKKAESPEKQARKLNRRSKRNRKSDSPEEQPEEVGSEYSVDENTEDDEGRAVYDNERRENDQYDTNKAADDQKAQLKEEESGGSDGSWKVKSENGGSGGIPKLKLCLTRPPDMSSPTSEQPSPRRRRRGRGTASPAKEEQQIAMEDVPEEKESPKRSTRSQKAKEMAEAEIAAEAKKAESVQREEPLRSEPCDSTNVNHSETEEETQMAVDSIIEAKKPEETEDNVNDDRHQTADNSWEEHENEGGRQGNSEVDGGGGGEGETPREGLASEEDKVEKVQAVEAEEKVENVENMEGVEKVEKAEEEVGAGAEKQVEETGPPAAKDEEGGERAGRGEEEKEEKEEEKEKEKAKEAEAEEKEKERSVEEAPERKEEEPEVQEKESRDAQQNDVAETRVDAVEKASSPKPADETEKADDDDAMTEEQEKQEMRSTKRSPSRDSSEERAKEAALRSRNKYRKLEGSEEGEVVESPISEKFQTSARRETDKSQVGEGKNSAAKENQEESMPAKANSRKRRWGASTSRVTKKASVSISTDFLKEIIPEVKPLPMSEVHLSPNEEEEEGQVKDSEDNAPAVTKKVDREKMQVQSDESEKDYEEEAVESGAEESPKNEAAAAAAAATAAVVVKAVPQVKEKEFTTFTRKVSVLPSNDLNRLQRSPSPPRNKPSNILYIVNLVRPFTIPQLRELLARTGTIADDGFWIDKIKSRCYVKYDTEEEAKTTRHALHGVRWPVSNPKQLNVDFGTEAAMKAAQEGNEIVPKRSIPSLFDKQIDLKSGEKSREREERSREKKERSEKEKKDVRMKHREDEKREDEEKDKKVRPPVEPLVRDRTVRRVTVPVREWDVGKNEDGFSPPPDGMDFGRHRDDRYERRVEYERDKRDEYDDRRRRDKDRGRRSMSNEPPRKSKKKSEEEAPAKLLDDLFRKTKATPCIYWLPLTSEQIAVKEELRRKHMAEHEKRVAELRKIQRDQNKRSSDKRRRRTKSRSRSRSPKK